MKNLRPWIMPVVIGVVLVALLVGALIIYSKTQYQLNTSIRAAAGSSETTPSPGPGPAGPAGTTSIPGVASTATGAAPDFTMTDASGRPIQLSSFQGKPTIVNFWATWCRPCREELPGFQKMYEKYGDRVNFVMLNIVAQGDTAASVQKFCKDNGYTFPVYFDESGEGATVNGVTGIPETIFINAEGKSYGKVVGGLPVDMLASGMQLLTR